MGGAYLLININVMNLELFSKIIWNRPLPITSLWDQFSRFLQPYRQLHAPTSFPLTHLHVGLQWRYPLQPASRQQVASSCARRPPQVGHGVGVCGPGTGFASATGLGFGSGMAATRLRINDAQIAIKATLLDLRNMLGVDGESSWFFKRETWSEIMWRLEIHK